MRKFLLAAVSTLAIAGGASLAFTTEAKAACLTGDTANNCVTFDPTTPSDVNKNFFDTTLREILTDSENVFQINFLGLNDIDLQLSDITLTFQYGASSQIFTYPNATILGNNNTNSPPLSPLDVYISDIRSATLDPTLLTDAFLTYTIGAIAGPNLTPGNGLVNPVTGIALDDVLVTRLSANDTGESFLPGDPNVLFYGPGVPPGTLVCTEVGGPCTQGEGDNFFAGAKPQVEATKVPGPLPILGAGIAFGYSRKLRKRISSLRTF